MVRMQFIAQFRLWSMRRRHADATGANQLMRRLLKDRQLKFATGLFVLPADANLHQPFHMLR
jgi:hypothetical protein